MSLRPVSTYRLQLHGGCGFGAARDLVPYLAELGVTTLYSSPVLQANPGSLHGYDICNHGRLNPELGADAAFADFCAALRRHGLGHLMDFVPNHMASDPTSNRWWRDVLENGPSSPYAAYFDIDWDPVKPELENKVLLPVLGDQYGRVLERGELRLQFDRGALHVHYGGHLDLPVNPSEAPRILGRDIDRLRAALGEQHPDLRELLSVIASLQNLPAYTDRDPEHMAMRHREASVARERLARLADDSAPIRGYLAEVVFEANGTPGDPSSFDALHALLEAQPYRLAYWRTAFDEVNYRRFFDINELVGLRMEEPEVFEATHALVARLIAAGDITGIRVDHPDGLYDPEAYFVRLQALARESRARGAAAASEDDFYIVAEKILSAGEALQRDWPIAGTTGYSFLNLVAGLFIDARHAGRLRRIHAHLTGRQDSFEEVAYRSKRIIMATGLASELNVLGHALNRMSEGDRRQRDFTLNACRRVLMEVVACFPVYRTYITEHGASAFDREVIGAAIAEARRRNPVTERSIFAFLEHVLLGEGAAGRHFAMKLQQLTGPVQAKGVEDTAFYRYDVLVSANDVGGHPGRLGVSATEFHEANALRLAEWPLEMITTATHDTKRGEDARARISAISEVPDEWRRAVSAWTRTNARHRTQLGGAWAPDRNDEYLFYQALVGAWPMEPAGTPVPRRAPDELAARLSAYMQKAAREAKVHTSWIDENEPYGLALARFVEQTLTSRTAERFLRSFVPFTRRLARAAVTSSLAQLVLKLASPGVPDFYQGNELWDLNLVDPDNRRPVDFALRRRLLDDLRPTIARIEAGTPAVDAVAELVDRADDGRIKLLLTACGLRLRRAHAPLFLDGAYVPLEASGPAAEHLVAFARVHATGTAVVVAPRLVVALTTPAQPLTGGALAWRDTSVALPVGVSAGAYRHAFTGETIAPVSTSAGAVMAAAALFNACPVALLVRDGT